MRSEVDRGAITMTVDDDGPGIAPAMREAGLQRGVRADEASPGTGFGLAIVRDLAELYGRIDRARRVAARRPAGPPPAAVLVWPALSEPRQQRVEGVR